MLRRILVVEDDQRHLQDAIRVLEQAGMEVITSSDAAHGQDAAGKLRANSEVLLEAVPSVDGAIIDVYMPLDTQVSAAHYQDKNQPHGLVVAAACQRMGIPFVLCTAGYHHGVKYQWIDAFCNAIGWKLVDCYNNGKDVESPVKDWAGALAALQERFVKAATAAK